MYITNMPGLVHASSTKHMHSERCCSTCTRCSWLLLLLHKFACHGLYLCEHLRQVALCQPGDMSLTMLYCCSHFRCCQPPTTP